MTDTTKLDLTNEELALTIASVRGWLGGTHPARTSLENKLSAAEKRFGFRFTTWQFATGDYLDSTIALGDFYDQYDDVHSDPEGAQKFTYDGIERVVTDVKIDGKRQLLTGFEHRRGSEKTESIKSYKLNRIGW